MLFAWRRYGALPNFDVALVTVLLKAGSVLA